MKRRTIGDCVRGALGRGAVYARRLTPRALAESAATRRARAETEALLAGLLPMPGPPAAARVLVDAMYDNPNYWIRYALLRAALGLSRAREVAVLGPYRARDCRRTLRRLGVEDVMHIGALVGARAAHRAGAARLLADTRTADDILRWRLPEDFPADFVYDGLLKRQRAAVVDLDDPRLPRWVAEALGSIAASRGLLESTHPDLVVLSHAVNFQFGSLAWLALQRGIPVVLATGYYGVPRFVKFQRPGDVYDWIDRPTASDLTAVASERATRLASVGRRYLDARLGGHAHDLGALYAFRRATEMPTRQRIAERFGWDAERPIVAVYASNWFDFPHPCGMTQFRDFLDWMRATLDAAVENRRVNWLFKAHPCDAWYGGVTLSDLVPSLDTHPHVRLVPVEWNGAALLRAVDALVTVHGTAGVEFAAAGKPVLVADRGWYHHAGFVRWPRSRAEYLEALASDWWKDLDVEATTRQAQVFSGWYFTRPAWQDGLVMEDDPRQAAIYRTAPRLLTEHPQALALELATIRKWFASPHRHYHTYKMSVADEFAF